MRTETRTVRIGEWLGPVDWDYDFASHGWDRGGSHNPACIPDEIAALRAVEEGFSRGERWNIYAYGGCYPVIQVGMYDGWPYWKPTPSYLVERGLGAERLSWMCASGASQVAE